MGLGSFSSTLGEGVGTDFLQKNICNSPSCSKGGAGLTKGFPSFFGAGESLCLASDSLKKGAAHSVANAFPHLRSISMKSQPMSFLFLRDLSTQVGKLQVKVPQNGW